MIALANKYEMFVDEGTTKLMDMFSSPQVDAEEKAEIVDSFASELEDHICNDDTMPNCECFINSVLVTHVDKKLSSILAKEVPSYSDFETALALCNRMKTLLATFAENGWMLPAIKNSNPDDCEKNIKRQQEENFRLNKLVQLDQQIGKAIAQAERELSTESCNAAVTLLDELNREIELWAKKKGTSPAVKNADTKTLYQRMATLKKTAEQKEALYSSILETDARLHSLEAMSNPTAVQYQEAVNLCQELKKLIVNCKNQQFLLPKIRYTDPDTAKRRFAHYQEMFATDQEISSRRNLSSGKQYTAFMNLCEKQARNIELCSKNNWEVPALSNPDPNSLMQTAEQEIKNFRKNVGKAILVVAIILSVPIIVITLKIKDYLDTVAVPFSSEYVVSQDCSDIREELENAGFTNIKTVASEDGWLDDNEVIGVTVDNDSFSKDDRYEPEVSIVITYSSTGRIDVSESLQDWQAKTCSDVVATLKEAGFTNITTIKQPTSNKKDDKLIAKISLNSNSNPYTNGHCYLPKDAPIDITYHTLVLNPPNSNAAFIGQKYKDVVEDFKELGFTNVQTEEIKTGWAESNSVIAVSFNNQISYSESDAYEPDVKIVVKYSSNNRIKATNAISNWRNIKYTELEKSLRTAGFTNITISQVETTNTSQNHLVAGLTINGESFNAGECYIQKTAPIIIKYYALMITVGEKASDIKGDNYTEVVSDLKAMGFTNITLKRANDLVFGWVSKEGAIQNISINGNSDFSTEDSFCYDAEIVIVVHTFKGKGCDDITIVDDEAH